MKSGWHWIRGTLLAVLLAVLIPVSARATFPDGSTFVYDGAGLLDNDEWAELESWAAEIARENQCGLYLFTTDDYQDYASGDVYDCAVEIYGTYGLGYGENRDGALLLLSMDDRDFALVFHGYGETAFTEYGRDLLEDAFLDNFRENDWYGGFWDFLSAGSYLLSEARNGSPVDYPSGGDSYGSDYYEDYGGGESHRDSLFGILLKVVFLPCLIAGLICMGMKSSMRSVRTAAFAGNYVPKGGFRLRVSSDTFSHTTETRVKIEEEHHDSGGSGSVHHSGGGYSGRSGKF